MIPLLATNVLADAKPLAGKAPLAAEDFDALLRMVAQGADATTATDAPAAIGATGKTPVPIIVAGTGQPDLTQIRSLIAAMTGAPTPASENAETPPAIPSGTEEPADVVTPAMRRPPSAPDAEMKDAPSEANPAPKRGAVAADLVAAVSGEARPEDQFVTVDATLMRTSAEHAADHSLPKAHGAAVPVTPPGSRADSAGKRPTTRTPADAAAKAREPTLDAAAAAVPVSPGGAAPAAQPILATPAAPAANIAAAIAASPSVAVAVPVTGGMTAPVPAGVSPPKATATLVTPSNRTVPATAMTEAITGAMLAVEPTVVSATTASDTASRPPPAPKDAAPAASIAAAAPDADNVGPERPIGSHRLGPIHPDMGKSETGDDPRLDQGPTDLPQPFSALLGKEAVPRSDGAAPLAASAAPMADIMVTHHLDLAKDGAWLDQLTQDIVRSADTSGAIRFSLAPEHLGRLDVSMAQTADGTALRLTTETREAHRIISDAQPRLVAEARAQGLTLSETSVDLGRRSDGGQPQAFGNQNSGGGGQSRHAGWQPVPNAPASMTEQTPAAARDDDLYA